MYSILKLVHVICVAASITGFMVRGVLALRSSPLLAQRWMRMLPHAIDSVLLGSAVGMAILSTQYPFVADWLTAKVLGLVAYVGLGVVVMRGRRPTIRGLAFVLALAVVGWIVSVALMRNPAGVFSWLP